MNKLLNKKKASEPLQRDATSFASMGTATPELKKSGTSRWKRTKKQPEAKPELNIQAALPSTDEFRTSLLMSGLSARFSMLREQDDPSSLIGKASDDSVLQPRRRSRLNFEFNGNDLNDIAEVQSIRSSIRPPFVFGRKDSMGGSEDGYMSENDQSVNGSIMTRARPGEGNVLFGGRQKVYKIPTSGTSSSTGLGRVVYEDDIGMSAFQRYRKERLAQDGHASEEEDPVFDFGLDQTEAGAQDEGDTSMPNDSAKDLSHSPSLSSYEKKRSTTSSTARSEARLSTAATSVASQPMANATSPSIATSPSAIAPAPSTVPLKRSDTKSRRLYEQGLNQDIYEQQASAITRLNSIHRNRSVNAAPKLHSTRSASNLRERPSPAVYALRTHTLEVGTGPLASLGPLRKGSSNASPMTSVPTSPISPAGDYDDLDVLTKALEPGDRGKATAMGAFNKPAQQFDEKQYLERQQQLQRSQSKTGMRKDSAPSLVQQRLGRLEQTDRNRSTSDASARSRSDSRPDAKSSVPKRGDSLRRPKQPTKAYNVFQNAANAIPSPPLPSALSEKSPIPQAQPQYDAHRTFFGNISASDSEDDDEGEQSNAQSEHGYQGQPNRWQPTPLPSVSEHPAFRHQAVEEEVDSEDLQPPPLKPTPSSQSLRKDAQEAEATQSTGLDSPTLGPSKTEPLNGMVHHLRQKSNQSSIFANDEDVRADEVPEVPDMPCNRNSPRVVGSEPGSRVESSYTPSNPWDLDEIDHAYNDMANHDPVSPIDDSQQLSRFGPRALSRTTLHQDRQSSHAREIMDGAVSDPWQNELRKQNHTRDASTATQQERDAFANELAARRTAIQENMRSMVERDTHSRGVSPASGASGARKAFGMLKSKPSRESVLNKEPAGSTKGMKALAMGASPSGTNLNSQYERGAFSFDQARPHESSLSRPPPTSRGMHCTDWQPVRPRVDSEASRAEQPTGPSPTSSSASRSRARSNSAVTTGRSQSRNRPYRDDLERAMVEGVGSSAAAQPDFSPVVAKELTPKTSPELMQTSFEQTRTRSNSRPPIMNGYFDSKNLQPIQTGRLAPNGTPQQLYGSAHSSARASPAASPMFQSPTPPLSGPSTPQGDKLKQSMDLIQPRQGMLRKKTISKHDISEPTLISSTSNIDTVNLPEGASLKNGMEEPPPLPPINPKRRVTGARKIFGLGRAGISDDAAAYVNGGNASNSSNYGRSKTPDPWMTQRVPEPDFEMSSPPRDHRMTSEGHVATKQSFENHSMPVLQHFGYPSGATSPERYERAPLPQQHGGMEGGMF
ncbi:hypothetical protein EJ03DRAFT_171127 [Teratosphaeria nubilosa]|uniref:Uncharacterized protein n=1 Tax=Teratosphaeria nubilosa TaxID=161662 RepID=A0A6G1LIN9_9PEZI|nr:hypothetical protein EJ03DRAFT_171127 [Teratosphaeria nubilosa]